MKAKILIGATAGAFAFAGVSLVGGGTGLTAARLALLGAALVCLGIYDFEQRRIPNRIVLPATAGCVSLAYAAGGAPASLPMGLALVVVLLLTSLAAPQALGMGDVKLALLLVVGLDGDAVRALTAGLAFAAVAALVVLARRGRVAWRAALPLAPFFAAGAFVSVLPWGA